MRLRFPRIRLPPRSFDDFLLRPGSQVAPYDAPRALLLEKDQDIVAVTFPALAAHGVLGFVRTSCHGGSAEDVDAGFEQLEMVERRLVEEIAIAVDEGIPAGNSLHEARRYQHDVRFEEFDQIVSATARVASSLAPDRPSAVCVRSDISFSWLL
jgi:hypothetical protein